MMLPLLPQLAVLTLCSSVLVGGHTESDLTQRPYVVLLKQDVVSMSCVLSVLLLLIITMAVCVYKPLPRR